MSEGDTDKAEGKLERRMRGRAKQAGREREKERRGKSVYIGGLRGECGHELTPHHRQIL